jgi:hypothetical protein
VVILPVALDGLLVAMTIAKVKTRPEKSGGDTDQNKEAEKIIHELLESGAGIPA